jgi:UDPglucose 6-dehydrogenase
MVKKIKRALGYDISGKTILFLGLTFKANTDDMRDASAITIIPALTEKGARVLAHDPQGTKEAKKILPEEVEYLTDSLEIYAAAKEADVLVLLTDWPEYAELNWEKLSAGKKGRIVLDLRNFFNSETVKQAGFNYVGLGREVNN